MSRDMKHTSTGPESLADEYGVLTLDEWYAVEDVVVWAMASAKNAAERADRENLTLTKGFCWEKAALAAAALAILRGVRDRTFDSHHALAPEVSA